MWRSCSARIRARRGSTRSLTRVSWTPIGFPRSSTCASISTPPPWSGCATHRCVRIDHPDYWAEAEVSGPLRAQLLADLAGRERPPLIDLPGRATSPSEECLLETGTLRVRRRSPRSTVLIECRVPVSLGEADPALLAELLPVLQRYVREIVRESGSCRVSCEVEGAGAPMRWRLRAGKG